MKDLNLRRKLYLKRKLLKAISYKPEMVTSIHRLEKPSEVRSEILKKYSDSEFTSLKDPRNGSLRGHYFYERNIYRIYDVILEPRQGIFYSSNGKLISESSKWPDLSQYNSFPWNPQNNIKKLPLENVINISANSFGHWLMEDLGGTIAALKSYPEYPVIVLNNPPKYVSDFLETIPNEVFFVNGPVKLKSAIMTERGKDSGWVHPKDFETLRSYPAFKSAREKVSTIKRVYASRSGLPRSPSNESEIEKLLKKYEFAPTKLHDMNLLEEISLIANLEIFVSTHGSAFSNQIWMRNNTTSIEIVNENYWTEMDSSTFENFSINKIYMPYSGELTSNVPLRNLKSILDSLFK